MALILSTGPLAPYAAFANPQNGQVQAGSATIQYISPTRLDIIQHTDRTVIDWTSFSIGVGEHTKFIQPSSSSLALNRVTGPNVSDIFGRLTANGNIILINRNGIIFRPGSVVDVNALLATTSNIANRDFMAGRFDFTPGSNPSGFVINEGSITVGEGGLAAFVAPWVRNSGVINARLGSVHLASGDIFTLDPYGDNLITLALTDERAQALGARPAELDSDAALSNSGEIFADGGYVAMSVAAVNGVIDTVINMDGKISARAVEQVGGTIVLKGGGDGAVIVAGTLDASGRDAGQSGGTVHVLGDKVGLMAGAALDVSGDAGGGEVLVGGNFQGNGVEQNASVTYVDEDAAIAADAITEGDGGRVIVWADNIARFFGSISATGGAEGGDGGFAEVSGKVKLAFRGSVDLAAPNGTGGTLLLDPANITLSTAAETNADDFAAGEELFADDDGDNTFLDVDAGGSFDGVGDGTTIKLQAVNDITLLDDFNLALATGDDNVSIILEAGNDIAINADLTVSGTGTITLTADADSFSSGAINAAAPDGTGAITRGSAGDTITQASGTLALSAGSGITATTSAPNITATSTSGDIDISNSLASAVTVTTLNTAKGGNITFAQSGGGNIAFGVVSTDSDGSPAANKDDITLSNENGDLTVTTLVNGDENGEGDTSLTTTVSGDINIGAIANVNGSGGVTLNSAGAVITGALLTGGADGIVIDAVGDVTVDLLDTAGDVTINTDGSILEASATNSITGATVTLNAGAGGGDSVGTDANRINVTATTLAGEAGTGGFYVDATGDANLGSIDITGAGDVVITATGSILDANAGAVNIETDANGSVTLEAGDAIGATGGASALNINKVENISLTAGGTISVDGNNQDLDNLAITVTPGGGFVYELGGFKNIDATITTDGTDLTITKLDVSDVDGNVSLTTTSGGIQVVSIDMKVGSGGGDLSLTAAQGAITDGSAGNEDINIEGGKVTLTAKFGIGGTGNADIDTRINHLFATTESGNIVIDDADVNGIIIDGMETLGSDIAVTAAGGITVGGAITAGGTGNVTLDANGKDSDVAVNAKITAGAGGSVAITADDSVTFSATGEIEALGAGTVDVTADDDGTPPDGNDGEVITMAAGADINAGSGAITLSAKGTVTVETLTTTNDIDVTSDEGSILQASLNNAVSGDTVTLNAGTGAGDSVGTDTDRINTDADTLAGQAGTGGFYVDEMDDVAIDAVTITAGDVTITAGGAITDGSGNEAANITAAKATLSADSIGGAAGNEDIDTDIDTIEAAAATGGVFIEEADGLTVDGSVTSGNGGDIEITLKAGDLTLDGDITADGSGDVTLTLEGAGAAVVTDNLIDDIASTDGDITITADNLDLALGTISTNGNLVLKPADTSRDIVVGDGSAGDFNLGNSEILLLTGNSITIGDATSGTGAVEVNIVTFTDDVIIVGGSVSVEALSAPNVTLTARTGAITDEDEGDDTTANITSAGKATLTADDNIGASGGGDIDTSVGKLQADAAGGGVFIEETSGLTVDGSVTSGNDGNIEITLKAGNLVLDGDITADDEGDVTITLNQLNAAVVTSDGSDNIASTSGDITITADTLTLANGTIASGGNLVLKSHTAARTIGIGNLTTGDLNLTTTEIGLLSDGFGNITIGNSNAGAVDVNAVTFTDNVNIGGSSVSVTGLAAPNVTLTAHTGAVTDGGGTVDVSAGALVIDAVNGVGWGNAIETDVDSLDVENSTLGNIEIAENDAVDVDLKNDAAAGAINLTAGGTITVASNTVETKNGNIDLVSDTSLEVNGNVKSVSGDITLTAKAGSITVANSGADRITTGGSGSVTLDAIGVDSDVNLNAGIKSGTNGSVTIKADDSINFSANGDVTAAGLGAVTIIANDDPVSAAGNDGDKITMDRDTVIDAGSGKVSITTSATHGGDIALGQVTTTNANVIDAVTVSSATGAITDADAGDDAAANITTPGKAVLTAATNIGVSGGGDIDTSVGRLQANAGNGGVFVEEANGLTIDGSVTSGNDGDIELTVIAGNLTLDGNITADDEGDVTITLNQLNAAVVTSAAGDKIASTSGDITITADTLTLANGAIASAGKLVLKSFTVDRTIGIGNGAAGALNLTTAEIGLLSNGFSEITIGDADAGAIDVNVITFNDDVIIIGSAVSVEALNAGVNDVTLTAQDAAITDGSVGVGEAANITAARATLSAATTIGAAGVDDDIDTSIATLEATAADGGVFIQEANGLTVDGSVTSGNNGDIEITLNAGDLTLDGDITADGEGDVNLTLNGAGAAVVTSGADDNIASTDGDITITADNLDLALGTISTNGDLVLKPHDVTRNIGIGGGAGDLNLDDGEIGLLSVGDGGTITIGDAAAGTGAVDVDEVTLTDDVIIVGGSVSVTGLTAPNATLTARTGAVTDGGAGVDVTTAALVITAVSGVGSGDAIETDVDSLVVHNTGSGNIEIVETDDVEVDLKNDSPTGTVNLTAGGTVTVVSDTVSTIGGVITLQADDDLVVNGSITSLTGDITLQADDVQIGGTIQGSANLFLLPNDLDSSIGIGGGDGDFNLNTTEIGFLADGFDQVFIGDPVFPAGDLVFGSGVIEVGDGLGADIVFNDDTTITGDTIEFNDARFVMSGLLTVAATTEMSGTISSSPNESIILDIGGGSIPNLNLNVDHIKSIRANFGDFFSISGPQDIEGAFKMADKFDGPAENCIFDNRLCADPASLISRARTAPSFGGSLANPVQLTAPVSLEGEEQLLGLLADGDRCSNDLYKTMSWQNTASDASFNTDPTTIPYSVDIYCGAYTLTTAARGSAREYNVMTYVMYDFWTDHEQSFTTEPLPLVLPAFGLLPDQAPVVVPQK